MVGIGFQEQLLLDYPLLFMNTEEFIPHLTLPPFPRSVVAGVVDENVSPLPVPLIRKVLTIAYHIFFFFLPFYFPPP